jgi:predicted transcriptional regulator
MVGMSHTRVTVALTSETVSKMQVAAIFLNLSNTQFIENAVTQYLFTEAKREDGWRLFIEKDYITREIYGVENA